MLRISGYEVHEIDHPSAKRQAVTILGSILVALMIGGTLIKFVSKVDPLHAYWSLLYGAWGSKYLISETMIRAIPLILMGLATTVCFRAQVWNIGGDGQIFAGAVLATVLSLHIEGLPSFAMILIILVGSAAAGSAWAMLAGFLRARYGLNEIFVTLMMNYIMQLFSIFLLEEIWREATWGMPWSETFPNACWLPAVIPGTKIHVGLIIALIGIVYVHILLFRTCFGYELRAFGFNARSSEIKGINTSRVIIKCMAIAGILAGITGAGQVCGVTHRLVMDINPGYGFSGIIVALMGRLKPFGVLISGCFLGSLANGAYNMEATTGIPNALIDFVQGVILICVISAEIVSRYRIRKVPEVVPRQTKIRSALVDFKNPEG